MNYPFMEQNILIIFDKELQKMQIKIGGERAVGETGGKKPFYFLFLEHSQDFSSKIPLDLS